MVNRTTFGLNGHDKVQHSAAAAVFQDVLVNDVTTAHTVPKTGSKTTKVLSADPRVQMLMAKGMYSAATTGNRSIRVRDMLLSCRVLWMAVAIRHSVVVGTEPSNSRGHRRRKGATSHCGQGSGKAGVQSFRADGQSACRKCAAAKGKRRG